MRTISKHAALMFSVLKWGILFVVSLGLVLFFLLWLMLSSLGETTVYTEQNLWDYHTLTQDAIAHAPRISANYHFEFHNGDGYPSSNSIIFEDARNIEALRDYVKSMGYQRDPSLTYGAEEWRKPGVPGANTFSIYYDPKTRQATLSIFL
ncbi:hypothetical protein GA0061071_102312 [Kosakonia oryzendophytica]|uniref:Uncharacterized protein n=1 Tax=Kosakonia oryzendophytica TaxID=1005665 RepID=A0A1C4A059_9ENTR|nr:hypothetical protein [Kosakonia oryzendophytica]AMO50745.1 Hypothetical protein AKI40_4370 [Enterobacter sp. FY-07]TDT52389.1 hypothetical protein DFO53_3554 [Enterobacter sp. AG5470]WBT57686.1 hypothetical protein O9K67_21550 [Kosakonia oryzendophytica]SCB88019.1 hypothetical protein GA0061071_102312 [Kosakonia oryzendophytica]